MITNLRSSQLSNKFSFSVWDQMQREHCGEYGVNGSARITFSKICEEVFLAAFVVILNLLHTRVFLLSSLSYQ